METQNRRPGERAAALDRNDLSSGYPPCDRDAIGYLTQYARYRRPNPAPVGVPFEFGGSGRVCPLCHVFLTPSSTAVRLPEPGMPVQMIERDGHYVSAVTGKPFFADGRQMPQRAVASALVRPCAVLGQAQQGPSMTAATANRPRLLAAEHPVILAALDLHRAERVPLPIEPGSKRPASPSWQRVTYTDEAAVIRAFGRMVEGAGVGVRLGDGLADVDLDTPTARRAAPLLLPGTGAKSGRPGSPASHWWYLVDADHYVKHDRPDGATVVELRASQGHQTVVPPSGHPSGEVLRWEGSGSLADAAEVDTDELRAGVAAVAVASILADGWPGQGSRHDAFLALSGGLLRDAHDHPGMREWAHRIITAVAQLTGDDEAEHRAAEALPSTVDKLAAGEAVTGWTTLAGLLAANDPEAVVKAAQRAADHLRDALGVPRVGVSVVDDTGPSEAVMAAFWAARPLLSSVLAFARSRRVGPWALLGAVLARAAACVPPSVVLPPTRGADASLNVFVGLCGESGSGKSATMEAAREFLVATGGTADFLETSPGSGEGLLAAYVFTRQERGRAPEVIQTRLSVLLDVDEVGSLGALATRTNSTLLPFLKSAWVGKGLGTQNAEVARLRRLAPHTYRLAIVAGVQPAHAGAILDDAAGGFPQRWLWMPTYDPGMLGRGVRAVEPPPWHWSVPGPSVTVDPEHGVITWARRLELTVPDEAKAAILDAADAGNVPIGARGTEGLDGHAVLSRLKVAALLGLLDGRAAEVSAKDWELAGVVLAVSDHTRAAVVAARVKDAQRADDRRAARVGRSAAIAADSEAETRTVRAMAAIRRKLAAPETSGEMTANALGKALGGRHKPVLADALARLLESGELVADEREADNRNRAVTTFYRLASGVTP